MVETQDERARNSLLALEENLRARGEELALFLVFDRPTRVEERPGLARAFFAQRCVTDRQINRLLKAFRAVGSYVELLEGELPMLEALARSRIQSMKQPWKVLYNGIEGGISWDGFEPGRKALIPAVADAYELICANSNAYACALGRHKFHYFTVMRALGIRVPDTWHYRPQRGWAGDLEPVPGTKVIVKSTYESWSVGVTEDSIFEVDESCEERVRAIAEQIGQPATVQQFVAGTEVCVPILSCPELVVCPPVETILAKAPGDATAFTTIHDNLVDEAVTHRRFCGTDAAMEELTRNAVAAFEGLELQSFARIDFRVDEAGRSWVTDVGVSPSISIEDSTYHSVAELDIDHPTFIRAVVAASLATRGCFS
jgi:D-alanine-D-alanine ligase